MNHRPGAAARVGWKRIHHSMKLSSQESNISFENCVFPLKAHFCRRIFRHDRRQLR